MVCAVLSQSRLLPPQEYPRQPEQPAWYGQEEGDASPDDRAFDHPSWPTRVEMGA